MVTQHQRLLDITDYFDHLFSLASILVYRYKETALVALHSDLHWKLYICSGGLLKPWSHSDLP